MQVVIPEHRRVDASSKAMFSVVGVSVVATMLGPALFAAVGPTPALAINIATFVISAALVAATRLHGVVAAANPSEPFLRSLREGLVTAWRTPSIRLIVAGVAVYGLSLGVNSSVLALFALETLSLSVQEYGFVSAMFAAGGLIGSLMSAKLLARVGVERSFIGSLAAMGTSYMVYSLAGGVMVAAVVMLVAGIAFSIYAVSQGPILQAATPAGFMGRITAITVPVLAFSSLLATVLSSQAITIYFALNDGPDDPVVYRVAIFFAACLLALGGFVLGVTQRRRTPESSTVSAT